MSSQAPIPADVPDGMVHVGWRCTNPDHTCLRALSDVDPQDGPLRWDHNATWAPVFAHAGDLERMVPDGRLAAQPGTHSLPRDRQR